MTESAELKNVWSAEVPWSQGCLSARLWQKGRRVMVCVPEVDICCYGRSQSEAILRLFSHLLKYHNELNKSAAPLSDRQKEHFILLQRWVSSVESRMTLGEDAVITERPAAQVGTRR